MVRPTRLGNAILPPVLLITAVVSLAVGAWWYVGGGRGVPAPTTIAGGIDPVASPEATTVPTPPGTRPVATRIAIASLGIDLPVISGAIRMPGPGPDDYPPCDVALYLPEFVQPGERGTTYLYAHARAGMFLPLLTASERADGASLIGTLVEVDTSDGRQHVYAITRVKRHALDLSLALDVPARARRLVLQTSEGPAGTAEKLQVLAEPIATLDRDDAEPVPSPQPRNCYEG
jgi:hypothetical protein